MSRIKTAASTHYFAGQYIGPFRDVLLASLVSGQHAAFFAPPGTGKTSITSSVATDIFGGNWSFVALDESTPPSEVKGYPDPAAVLGNIHVDYASVPVNRRLSVARLVAGTPFDPDARVAVIDEFGRGNQVVWNAMLQLLDNKFADPAKAPSVWLTANYIKATKALEALFTRVTFWYWLPDEDVPWTEIAAAQLSANNANLHVPGDLLTPAEIADLRTLQPAEKGVRAVQAFLDEIRNELTQQGKPLPDRRRVTLWARMLYRVSAWQHGQADFSEVHQVAKDMLRYAWPALSADEAADWRETIGVLSDSVGEIIEKMMADAAQIFNQVAGLSAAERTQQVGDISARLAKVIQATKENLDAIQGDDLRIDKAKMELTRMMSDAMAGRQVAFNLQDLADA